MELGLQIPIASGIPDSTSKNFPDSENRITFHLAYTEKNRAQCEGFNPGQKSSGQYCLQYSYFSVISRFPLKKVLLLRNSLAVLPSPTLYKVETRK